MLPNCRKKKTKIFKKIIRELILSLHIATCIGDDQFLKLDLSSFEQGFDSNVWGRGESLMVTSGRPSQIPGQIHQEKDTDAW